MKAKKILQFIKCNKNYIIGLAGVLIAEVSFISIGYNKGRKDAYIDIKEHLVNNEYCTIINTNDK